MGWASDALYGERTPLDINKIKNFMKPTQDLVSEQLGLSRGLMDPNSTINLTMKRLMASRAAETGAQQAMNMRRMAAQGGVGSGQAMMNAKQSMNQSMGNVNQNWLSGLQGQFTQGLGLMGNMTQMQQGLNEQLANVYVSQVNAANARRASNKASTEGFVQGLFG